MLLQPRRRVVQPQGPVEIDWANPLARGLIQAYLGSGDRYLVGGAQRAVPTKVVGPHGFAEARILASMLGVTSSVAGSSASVTMLSIERTSPAASVVANYFKLGNSSTAARLYCSSSDGVTVGLLTARAYFGGATRTFGGSFTRQPGDWYTGVVRHLVGYGTTLFVDGQKDPTEALGAGTHLGYGFHGTRDITGVMECASALSVVWSRALSDAEVAAVSANPWQLFRPLPARLLVDLSGPVSISRPGGGTELGAWTSTDATLWQAIGEAAPDDATFITSPELLAGAQASELIALTPPVAVGVLSVRLRAQRTQASGQLRVVLTTADGTPVGASAWQVLGSSYSLHTLSATTTGTATHFRFEVKL